MNFQKNVIINGGSISCLSENHQVNMDSINNNLNFFSHEGIEITVFNNKNSGKIEDSIIEEISKSFKILPKNRKFFNRSSVCMFHSISAFLNDLKKLNNDETALYASIGPAFASYDFFKDWAAENNFENDEVFSTMMASKVIQLLPNIIMSNLAINLEIKGENSIFSGTSMSSLKAIQALLINIENDISKQGIAVSSSNPYNYFNLDSYNNYFKVDFFDIPLSEASSAILIQQKEEEENTIGSILSMDFIKLNLNTHKNLNKNEKINHILKEMQMKYEEFEKILIMPDSCGNFLTASEPLGILATIDFLNKKQSSKKGCVIDYDYFGNYCLTIVKGRS